MARLHGITKSAVSQAVRKLIRRGPVHDYETSENRKEVLFRLSDRGIEAFTAHNAFHDTFERHYVEELAGYTEEEARGVEKAVEMLLPRAQAVYRQEGLDETTEGERQWKRKVGIRTGSTGSLFP